MRFPGVPARVGSLRNTMSGWKEIRRGRSLRSTVMEVAGGCCRARVRLGIGFGGAEGEVEI